MTASGRAGGRRAGRRPAGGRSGPVSWRQAPADDTGSLTLALLLSLVGVALSGLLAPMVLTQIGATRQDVRRVHALNAAQAGLDVALGHIRAASDGAGGGVLAGLPCEPLTGAVGAGGTARYQVTIDYLAVDPQGRSNGWVVANRIPCVSGAGPVSVPGYARLLSRGTDEPAGSFDTVATRSLRATYTFRMTVGAPAAAWCTQAAARPPPTCAWTPGPTRRPAAPACRYSPAARAAAGSGSGTSRT